MEEVYTQGKKQVRMLANSGAKDVDVSLFDWDEDDEETFEKPQGERQEGESTKGSSAESREPSGANV